MTARIENEIDLLGMRAAGRAAASVLEMIGDHVQPGVTTEELDRLCHQFIVEDLGCIPAPSIMAVEGRKSPSRSLFVPALIMLFAMAYRARRKS